MENQWVWKGESKSLRDLSIGQLNSINSTLTKHKGTTWFGLPSVDWRKAINQELKIKNAIQESKQIINNIYKPTNVHRNTTSKNIVRRTV